MYSEREKQTIRKRVQRAVKRGQIIRPSNCEWCGSDNNGQTLDAHHEDYGRPLDVNFICRVCHNRHPKGRRNDIAPPPAVKVAEVVEWLIANPNKRTWSVRKIAAEVGVSKSWVAVAKRYEQATVKSGADQETMAVVRSPERATLE